LSKIVARFPEFPSNGNLQSFSVPCFTDCRLFWFYRLQLFSFRVLQIVGFLNYLFYRFRLLSFRVSHIPAFSIPGFTDPAFLIPGFYRFRLFIFRVLQI
jgi:hypothetical protein